MVNLGVGVVIRLDWYILCWGVSSVVLPTDEQSGHQLPPSASTLHTD